MGTEPRHLRKLTADESLSLLASTPFGRVVFSERALPAIRPVNHVVDRGAVIIRTHLGAAVLGSLGMVVAYQADSLDPRTRLGWSVIVTGFAERVLDAGHVERYERMLRPWVVGEMDQMIRIRPRMITGYELVEAEFQQDADREPA